MNCPPRIQCRLGGRFPRFAAFTLVELLVVVVIVLILVALLFPSLKRGIDSARKAACLGNLRSIGAAAATYAGENSGFLPATYVFRETDSQGGQINTAHSWSAAMDPYLTIPPTSGSGRFVRSPYRCPANPIGGINYTLVNGVARFSTYQWDPRKNVLTLASPSKVPYLTDGPPISSQILGRPTRATDSSMVYVVLSPGAAPGGTSIRTRTGPNNPSNSNNYWIPPHEGGNALNILYADGSARGVTVPFFISDDPETGFYSENIIPPGNPNPNP